MDNTSDKQILFKEECYAIQGAVFEVYKEMGSGFLESVYQECLEMELRSRNIPFKPQVWLELSYKQKQLQQKYKADLICFDSIMVELKAVKDILAEHRAQLHNYRKASGLRLGLLINFVIIPRQPSRGLYSNLVDLALR